MKNVLITRQKNDAKDIAKSFKAEGFSPFIEPLFKVERLEFKKNLETPDFVIITSSKACYLLKMLNLDKKMKIYAVGSKTAKIVKDLGFERVFYPEKSSALALKEVIINNESEKNGIYLRGEKITLDFARELKAENFEINDIIVYKIKENQSFSSDLIDFCKKNDFQLILIFSVNSAKIFSFLSKKHNLLEYFNKSEILCFSEKILGVLKKNGFTNLKNFFSNEILNNYYNGK